MNLQLHPLMRTLVFVLGLVTPFAGLASANNLSRDGAITIALGNNPQLAVAEAEIERARSGLRWAGKLDNPTLDLAFQSDEFDEGTGDDRYEFSLSQSFPLTSRLRKEKLAHGTEVAVAEAEVAAFRQRLAAQVDAAYVDLAATQGLIASRAALVEAQEKFIELLREQADQGQVSPLDVAQAELGMRSTAQGQRLLSSSVSAKAARLKQLMGFAPDRDIGIGSLPELPASKPSAVASLDTVLGRRAEYRIALAQINVAKAGIELEESKRFEDITVGIIGESEDLDGRGENTTFGLGVSVPLPLWQRNQAGIEGAEIDHRSAAQSLEALRYQIAGEYELARAQRELAWEFAQGASGKLIELAREHYEDTKTAYSQGQADFRQIRAAQEQLIELENAALEAIADYHRAAVQLKAASGDYPTAARPTK